MIHMRPIEVEVAAKCWRLVRSDSSRVDYPYTAKFKVPECFSGLLLVLEHAGGEIEHDCNIAGQAGCTVSAPGPFILVLEAS